MIKRRTKITRNYIIYPEGSVLIETGQTKVLCNVTVEEGVPGFINDGKGWITAEYSMLPRSTDIRNRRESVSGKIKGRTAEIQRLIGRSLRAIVDRERFANYTILVDCDVLQADGGTRTASITGACVALYDAFVKMIKDQKIEEMPLKEMVAAISVGVIDGNVFLDLDYEKDSNADVDMNVVMTESGKFVELQGTAEHNVFDRKALNLMLDAAEEGIIELIKEQKKALELL